MAQSSILGGDQVVNVPPGHDIDSLGPSDSSDSGSDVQGERVDADVDGEHAGAMPSPMGSDTDAVGTGERGSATGRPELDSPDIRPDRIFGGPADSAADVDLADEAADYDTADETADETADDTLDEAADDDGEDPEVDD